MQYKDFVPIYRCVIIGGDEIVRACDRHWDETVTLTKHVIKYKYMWKWMVEFLSKSQSRVIKIAQLTQFAWPNLSIYFNLLCAVPRDDVIDSTRFLMRPPVNHSTMAPTEPVLNDIQFIVLCYEVMACYCNVSTCFDIFVAML